MTDVLMIAIIVSVAAVSVCAIFCGLLYSAIKSLTTVSGVSSRAIERRERNSDAQVVRLIEKLQAKDPYETACLHANERTAHARMDASVEKKSMDAFPTVQQELAQVGLEDDNYE